ncbi:hypothetical protein GCM10022254_72030 [Actinomadura meridiana]|uniref:GmrSD restriction endonucleases N-terminal domain-containing protein n=1 Tax=Actinomadura meridiana TaxID=559626 RepID=A0ABP8CPK2_9ACTN
MNASLDTRPVATMFDVETLVNQAWAGMIRVPHFQRDFRWHRSDVSKLFDSIVRGYPVGSLLLWRKPAVAKILTLGDLRIDAPQTQAALWVVDGQQRITSLANALHPDVSDARFLLAYDLRARQFVPTPPVEEPTIIPLPVLFNLTKVLSWFGSHPEAVEHVEHANEITQRLRQFPIPAYEVVHDDTKVLQDIFDRMNNYGKRLSRAEIFSALFAGEEDEKDVALTFDKIAQNIDDDLGFGLIDNDTVLQSVLARRGPDTKREIRNEFREGEAPERSYHSARAIIEFPDEDRETAYRLAEEAMRRAVQFLQNEASVPHYSFLPYRHLLVVLTRLFAHHPKPDERNLRLLRRWFWRAAVVGPEAFKGSTTGAIRFLSFAVKPDDLTGSLETLLSLVDRPDSPLPDLRRFRSNEAATKMVLCSWWQRGPRSLEDGEPFDIDDLSATLQDRQTALDAVRYVVPRRLVPPEYRMWAANRVLMPVLFKDVGAVEDLIIGAPLIADPDEWADPPVWPEALASHEITPEMVEQLRGGDTVGFLRLRQGALQRRLTDFLSSRCEWGFENTPPLDQLLVEDLEEDDELA